jgi:hypothetical protein
MYSKCTYRKWVTSKKNFKKILYVAKLESNCRKALDPDPKLDPEPACTKMSRIRNTGKNTEKNAT